MEPKIEDLIKKSGELTIEKIKEASKKLANNEKFITLNKRLAKVIKTMEDFEESAEEMKKGGSMDESFIKSVENNYKAEMEKIISAISGMIWKESGTKIEENDAVFIDGMIDDVLMTEEEKKKAEPADYSGVTIKRDQPEEPKK